MTIFLTENDHPQSWQTTLLFFPLLQVIGFQQGIMNMIHATILAQRANRISWAWSDFARWELVFTWNFLSDTSPWPLHHPLPNWILTTDCRVGIILLILQIRKLRKLITASQLVRNKLSSELMSFYHQSWCLFLFWEDWKSVEEIIRWLRVVPAW